MDRAKEKITLEVNFSSPRTFLTVSLLTQKATFFSKHTALRGYLPFCARVLPPALSQSPQFTFRN
jgi:hypothetical protein